MEVSLSPRWQKYVKDQLQNGSYRSADEIIEAALISLETNEAFGCFGAGELDVLLAEADEDFEKGNIYDGEEIVRELKEMSAAKRRES